MPGRLHWLSCENYSIDGTLIQVWASHMSFVRKDGTDDDCVSSSGTVGS